MKLDQLRKIIREEVRAAVKEELQEVMNEAVKIASTPSMQPAPAAGTSDWSSAKKPNKEELAELMGLKTPPKATNIKFSDKNNIQEMLAQTQASMSGDDYQNVFAGSSDMVKKPNFASSMASTMGMTGNQPGIDISQLDFVKKAKAVYDLSNQKGKVNL
jgi:hypothetical protein